MAAKDRQQLDKVRDREIEIVQAIKDYDHALDTGFERNAATIALQKIRGILGVGPYRQGQERIARELDEREGNR